MKRLRDYVKHRSSITSGLRRDISWLKEEKERKGYGKGNEKYVDATISAMNRLKNVKDTIAHCSNLRDLERDQRKLERHNRLNNIISYDVLKVLLDDFDGATDDQYDFVGRFGECISEYVADFLISDLNEDQIVCLYNLFDDGRGGRSPYSVSGDIVGASLRQNQLAPIKKLVHSGLYNEITDYATLDQYLHILGETFYDGSPRDRDLYLYLSNSGEMDSEYFYDGCVALTPQEWMNLMDSKYDGKERETIYFLAVERAKNRGYSFWAREVAKSKYYNSEYYKDDPDYISDPGSEYDDSCDDDNESGYENSQ